jgi:putative ABC transport system permease protein
VVGRTIRLDDQALTVIGVMPERFRDPVGEQADVWVPQNLNRESRWNGWNNSYLTAVGRLTPGVSLEEAQRRMTAFSRQLTEGNPDLEGITAVLVPLHEATVGSARATLWVLMTAVVLVLLSACVNVANLFLARAWSRRTELAVRSALGSGRAALARHLFSETIVLSLVGGAVGVGLAAGGVELFRRLGANAVPRAAAVSIDAGVLLFSLLVALGVGLVVGVVSLAQLSDSDAAQSLKSGERGGRASARQKRLRGLLVVTEVAAALVLTVGAGVLVRSLDALANVDLAVRSDNVLTYEVHLPPSRYEDGAARSRFYDDLFRRVEAIPGVETVGATSWLPVSGRYHSWGVALAEEGAEWHGTDVRVVDGEYFASLDIEVVRGRAFDPALDHAEGAPAIIVNRTVDEVLFPDVDLLGREVSINQPWTVVGIVEDVPFDAFGTTSPKVYLPHDQYAENRNWALIQTVATSVDPRTIVPRVREALASVDPNLVLYRVETFDDKLGDATARSRATTLLLGAFSGLALLLAAVGIYGVLGYLVSQRRHEIGVRMALGASPQSVWGLILKEGFGLAAAGIAIGLVFAVVGTRWLRSIVFGIDVVHAPTLALSALMLALIAGLAAFSPARRATRVDPVEAFRAE